MREPQVVSTSRVQKMSLWTMGRPLRRPHCPRLALVRALRSRQRLFGRNGDERVQRAIVRLNAVQQGLR